MKKLILAAALAAASCAPAFAQSSGSSFYGTPERQVMNSTAFGGLREFSQRRAAPMAIAATPAHGWQADTLAYPM
ncbi:hypothetical protein, partial [Klebsiella pneumoniae]|uniref:hypothetical protein n=1 Tax=Klebsiella pneumoniae TaxID=573 RepID=UPI0013D3579F